ARSTAAPRRADVERRRRHPNRGAAAARTRAGELGERIRLRPPRPRRPQADPRRRLPRPHRPRKGELMFVLLRWLLRRRAHKGAAAASPPAHGPVGLVLHQARYDLLGFLRNRQARFFTLALPLLFLVIFVSVFGNDTVRATSVMASTYYVPGISALAVIAASFVNLVISITAQREGGILKRRRATPVPAWVLIAGRTPTAMLVSLVVMTVVLLVGRFAYGVHLPTSTIPGVALTAIVGSATFCVLAYALSTTVNSED